MALVIDQKSESGFVFGSVMEFIKCWEAGSDSRLVLETINGRAWVNFSCCLGRPDANHVVTKRQKSPRKDLKDKMRAAAYHEKSKVNQSEDTKDDSQNVLNESVVSTEILEKNCDNCVDNDGRICVDWTVNVKTNKEKISLEDSFELASTVENSVEEHFEENCDVPIGSVITYRDDEIESNNEKGIEDGLIKYYLGIHCKNKNNEVEDALRLKQFLCKSSNKKFKLTRNTGFPNLSQKLELLGATFESCNIVTEDFKSED